MKRLRTKRIAQFRRAMPDEWLLIEVDRFDPLTTTPLTGRLVAHSRLRDPLERQTARRKWLQRARLVRRFQSSD